MIETSLFELCSRFPVLPHGYHELFLLALECVLGLPMLDLLKCFVGLLATTIFADVTAQVVIHLIARLSQKLLV